MRIKHITDKITNRDCYIIVEVITENGVTPLTTRFLQNVPKPHKVKELKVASMRTYSNIEEDGNASNGIIFTVFYNKRILGDMSQNY
jgi:hypothetical protein